MKRNLIGMELKSLRVSFLVGTLVLLAYQFALGAMADSFMGNAGMMELLEGKSAILESFGIDPVMMSSYEGWVGAQPHTLFVLLIGAFSAIWAGTCITRERDKGTAEYLFALPYARQEIFFSKAAAHLLLVTVIAGLTFLVNWLAGEWFSRVSDVRALLMLAAAGCCVALAFLGVGYLMTFWMTSERTATSAGIGIVLVMFFMGLLSTAQGTAAKLASLSLFRLFPPNEVVAHGSLTAAGVLITVGLYGIGLAAAAWGLGRQDL
ncbi:ABC transporter permease [Saccharibacillus alkalitolerans]|uniref:ABC transporter permease subunit n=1 Tax=Saccharibacillus alkalitolerans TaxID=2705290 RepID=A0ABX0FCV8_9BACL|nr:ABC transporter permease subunit [Saccharibacillus alkalitolerans]NGZ77463.1 ABC transporter permease subunit [Saccharibacillus alkalitolerans]